MRVLVEEKQLGDRDFSIDCQIGDIPSWPTACLVNAVANLAQQDFDARIEAVIARLPSYPDVLIGNVAAMLGPERTLIRYMLLEEWSVALS